MPSIQQLAVWAVLGLGLWGCSSRDEEQQREISRLRDDLALRDAEISTLRARLGDDAAAIATTDPAEKVSITAHVSDLRPADNGDLITLALPAGSTVRMGEDFTIHRDKRYIVRVRVVLLRADTAVCRVMRDTLAAGEAPQFGDAATNNL